MTMIDVDGSYSAEADKRDGAGLWVLVYSVSYENWETFAGIYSSHDIAKEACQVAEGDDTVLEWLQTDYCYYSSGLWRDWRVYKANINVLTDGGGEETKVHHPGVSFGWRE